MEPAFLSQAPGLGPRLAGLFFQAQCLDCGARVDSPALGGLCRPCWKRLPWILGDFKGARTAARFQGSWRQAIHAYKFEGRLSFRRPFARLLHGLTRDLDVQAVLGAPSSRAAMRARGFDPVHAFAKPLAASLGLPYLRALRRSREGAQQARLKRAQRLANARGAYQAELAPAFQGKALLLVDDVMTTGATLRACAQALRQAGAARVEVAVLAAGI